MAYVRNATGLSRRRRLAGYDALASGAARAILDNLPTDTDCECPAGCYPAYRRNVIYTGPCPPSPDDPCQPPLPPPPPDPPVYRPFPDPLAYGYFAQTDALAVEEAGGRVPLDSIQSVSPGAFRTAGGVITMLRPGVYEATFSLNVPEADAMHATVSLTLSGDPLPGASVRVDSEPGRSDYAMFQTVFEVTRPGMVLRVGCSEPVTLTAAAGETLASLCVKQMLI